MPAPSEATVRRDGDALQLTGALVGTAVPALWRDARPQAAGARAIDITGVTRIDSAGLALLSTLAGAAAGGPVIALVGNPPGLAELRAAYRLDAALGFGA